MDNKELILAHEKLFTANLASLVLVKPKLNAWMIFIPFIFIFYFQDFSKYKKNRKEFMANWLLSRKKALNEAKNAMNNNRPLNIAALAREADLKPSAREKYSDLLKVIATHYTRLLNAKGDTYETLVRSAYDDRRGNYIFFNNQLDDAEKELNKTLIPQLRKTSDDVKSTIKKIENSCKRLRQTEMDQFFSPTS